MNKVTKFLVVTALLVPQTARAGLSSSVDTIPAGVSACPNITMQSGTCPSSGLYVLNNEPEYNTTSYCTSISCIRGIKEGSTEYGVVTCNGMLSSLSSNEYHYMTLYAIYTGIAGASGPCFVKYNYVAPCASSQSSCATRSDTTKISESHSRRETVSWTCAAGCKTTTTYICNKGWYGNPTDATSGCEKCPQPDGWTADVTTPNEGVVAVQACYIPSGGAFSDSTGSGVLTSDCGYTQ